MNKINPEVALRRIEYFTRLFGEAHQYLAYHAAFPLALTPDLLYHLWANFQQDIDGKVLDIPWIAVADLLLSSLFDEVGYELYEMDLAVRNELLRQLQSDGRFGKQRINQLSDFLLEYVQNQLHSDDPDIQDFAKTQQWVALAYTQPNQAVRDLALTFSKLDPHNKAELVRMTSLTETFAEPLSEFQPLLIYARGMGKFARGNLEDAKAEFSEVLKKKKNVKVGEVNLPVPEQIKPHQTKFDRLRVSRRQFFKLAGFGGVGLVTAVVTHEFSQTRQTKTQTYCPFETVTVDKRGKIINSRNSETECFVEDLGKNVTLEMIRIPEGKFEMGSPISEKGRKRDEEEHRVNVLGFLIGRFEVTQAQYKRVMDDIDLNGNESEHPMKGVSWNNAVEFCKRLSQKTGRTYRLPSEAEWEYACRAGTETPFHFGETITTDLVNYDATQIPYASAPQGRKRQQTIEVGSSKVGSFPANAFGLYDMHGNVWEWCEDTWHDSYQGAPTDGSAWVSDDDNRNLRVLRGGSWLQSPDKCRSAYRNWGNQVKIFVNIGLRVVCANWRVNS